MIRVTHQVRAELRLRHSLHEQAKGRPCTDSCRCVLAQSVCRAYSDIAALTTYEVTLYGRIQLFVVDSFNKAGFGSWTFTYTLHTVNWKIWHSPYLFVRSTFIYGGDITSNHNLKYWIPSTKEVATPEERAKSNLYQFTTPTFITDRYEEQLWYASDLTIVTPSDRLSRSYDIIPGGYHHWYVNKHHALDIAPR